jgi:mannose-6-phosphate isomerase class I
VVYRGALTPIEDAEPDSVGCVVPIVNGASAVESLSSATPHAYGMLVILEAMKQSVKNNGYRHPLMNRQKDLLALLDHLHSKADKSDTNT